LTEELGNFATVNVFEALTSHLASRALSERSDQTVRLDGEEISVDQIRCTSTTEQTGKIAVCGINFTNLFRKTVINLNESQFT
jgi:hypothetical protein